LIEGKGYCYGNIRKMKVMIISVGGTPEPLIESIKNRCPDFVYFIASQETNPIIGKIVENTNLDIGKYRSAIIDDAESIIEAYEISRDIIRKIKKEYPTARIFINHTGGTKSMSAGIVLAGSEYGCSFVYVGGEKRDKGGVGIVTEGMIVKDEQYPYYLIAEKNLTRAIDYFNRYQYDTSINILKSIIDRLVDDSEKSKQLQITATILIDFIILIKNIDRFRFRKIEYRGQNRYALGIVNDVIKRLEMVGFSSDILRNIDDYLKISKDYFRGLQEGDPKIILCELINNAERRISEGKYDDAIARLYRAFELIAQIKLQEYGLDDLSDKKFTLKDLENRGVDVEKYKDCVDEKGKLKLGLKKKFELLKDLGWDNADDIYLENKKIWELLSKRNNSIMAHGLEPIDMKSTMDLFSEVEKIAKDMVKDYDWIKEIGKFPTL